jgi:hypothetical protein
MAANRRRWVRVDVTYEDRAWLSPLPGNVRRLFPSFIIYLKKNGVRGGAERLDAMTMGRKLDCTVEEWSAFINAAIASGAVVIDDHGDWLYTGWEDEQEISTERVQRHRARKAEEAGWNG